MTERALHSTETRRRRIVHLIHDDGPGGGPVTVVNHISYYVDFFDLFVIHGGRGKIWDACRRLKVPTYRLPLNRKAWVPVAFIGLVMKLAALKPDLLIVHGQWAAPVGVLAARLAGVGKVIYIAQWPSFYTDWTLGRVIRNHLSEAVPCRLADRTVAISEGNYYQFLFRGLVPGDRLRLIHNAIDLDRVPDAETARQSREKLGWNDGRCHVVSVGRLADQKRVDWLLKSWNIVRRQTPEAMLWILGDGPDRGMLEALAAKLGLGASCHFLGAQNGMEYISAADFVAMTSMYEGHANIPLEAMACGRPIVASKVDGVSDSFEDGTAGFLVPPGDIPQFAERMITLIRDPALRVAMGARGVEQAREFSKPRIFALYLTLINELLEVNARSGAKQTAPAP